MTTFRIPRGWGGRLSVVWELDTDTKNFQRISLEFESAQFHLQGTADGCALMTATGSP
jgi:hypothetical protein